MWWQSHPTPHEILSSKFWLSLYSSVSQRVVRDPIFCHGYLLMGRKNIWYGIIVVNYVSQNCLLFCFVARHLQNVENHCSISPLSLTHTLTHTHKHTHTHTHTYTHKFSTQLSVSLQREKQISLTIRDIFLNNLEMKIVFHVKESQNFDIK